MDYLQLVPSHQGYLIPAVIGFVVVSLIVFLVLHFTKSALFLGDYDMSLGCALVAGALMGVVAGEGLVVPANRVENAEIITRNVGMKYDVDLMNVESKQDDEDNDTFTANVISHQDGRAYDVTVLVADDGTPTIVNSDLLDAATLERKDMP